MLQMVSSPDSSERGGETPVRNEGELSSTVILVQLDDSQAASVRVWNGTHEVLLPASTRLTPHAPQPPSPFIPRPPFSIPLITTAASHQHEVAQLQPSGVARVGSYQAVVQLLYGQVVIVRRLNSGALLMMRRGGEMW